MITVPGRTFPVEVEYLPQPGEELGKPIASTPVSSKPADAAPAPTSVTDVKPSDGLDEGKRRALMRLAVEDGLHPEAYLSNASAKSAHAVASSSAETEAAAFTHTMQRPLKKGGPIDPLPYLKLLQKIDEVL